MPTDPLYKIKPLLDLFNNKMKEVCYPYKELSFDASMLLWRGRLCFRQYIADKKRKYDIKFYMLTQPNGLVLETRIYCGSADQVVEGPGHVEKEVKHLLEDYLGVGHSVTMASYYSGDHQTYSTGTLKANRKDKSAHIVTKKLKQGEVTTAYKQKGICVLEWCDKRDVIMISSEFDADQRDHKSKSGRVTKKSEAVMKYNEDIGGIDRSNQLLAYYPCRRKTLHWYAIVGIHIFHVIMNNAHLLYKRCNGTKKLTLLEFRDSLITSLLSKRSPPSGKSCE